MIRRYTIQEVNKNPPPPRLIIYMDIFDGVCILGANQHYSVDSDIVECCEDFFRYIKEEHPDFFIKVGRSKLQFRYIDLPK